MDATLLDRLARAMAIVPSRRDAVRALLGFTFGGAAVHTWTADAEARKCGPCRKKKKGKCKKKKPNNAACQGAGKCLNGKCNQPPTCVGAFTSCLTDSDCCSGNCLGPNPFSQCGRSATGEPCINDADCLSNVCTGFVCQ